MRGAFLLYAIDEMFIKVQLFQEISLSSRAPGCATANDEFLYGNTYIYIERERDRETEIDK